MSRTSKLRAREERAKAKRRKKDAMSAMYAAWRDAGINSKSKRSRKTVKTSAQKHQHPDGFCGNPACGLCFPKLTTVHVYVSARVPRYFRQHHITPKVPA